MVAMERWDIVAGIESFITLGMNDTARVYKVDFGGKREIYLIRWKVEEYDVVMAISIGSSGGTRGELYVLDRNCTRSLDDKLLHMSRFNPKNALPFRGFGNDREVSRNLFGELYSRFEGKKGKEAARQLAEQYMMLCTELLGSSDSEKRQAWIKSLRDLPTSGGSSPLGGFFFGGAPGLGRRR